MDCSLSGSSVHGIFQARVEDFPGWSGLPFPSPGDLPNPGIEAGSPALQADSLPNFPKAIIFEILNIGFSFHWLVCGFSSSTALTYARICISLYQFSYYWFAENWPL